MLLSPPSGWDGGSPGCRAQHSTRCMLAAQPRLLGCEQDGTHQGWHPTDLGPLVTMGYPMVPLFPQALEVAALQLLWLLRDPSALLRHQGGHQLLGVQRLRQHVHQ